MDNPEASSSSALSNEALLVMMLEETAPGSDVKPSEAELVTLHSPNNTSCNKSEYRVRLVPDESVHHPKYRPIYGPLNGSVHSPIYGPVYGSITGDVFSEIHGSVFGTISGTVYGTIFGTVHGSIMRSLYGTIHGDIQGMVHGKLIGTIHGKKHFPQGLNQGANKGLHQGMNQGLNLGLNKGLNQGLNQGLNKVLNQGLNAPGAVRQSQESSNTVHQCGHKATEGLLPKKRPKVCLHTPSATVQSQEDRVTIISEKSCNKD